MSRAYVQRQGQGGAKDFSSCRVRGDEHAGGTTSPPPLASLRKCSTGFPLLGSVKIAVLARPSLMEHYECNGFEGHRKQNSGLRKVVQYEIRRHRA